MVSAKNDGTHQNPNNDEEAALRHEAWQSVVKAEAWRKAENRIYMYANSRVWPLKVQEMLHKRP